MIALGCDHGGLALKRHVMEYLDARGLAYHDFGCYTNESCDYPDFADKVARLVARGEAERGVVICGTGLGVAITADKVAGVRACPIQTVEFARLAREHNDANVICLSGRFVSLEDNEAILDAFLTTDFQGGRHAVRVEKIMREDDPAFPGVPLDLGM